MKLDSQNFQWGSTALARRFCDRAFSLVEVVLAIGVMGFCLLVVFGLFSSGLQSNTEVINQVDSFGVTNATGDFLRAQPFATVYGWARDPANAPALYAYSIESDGTTSGGNGPGRYVVRMASDPLLTSEQKQRQGRLYRIYLVVSPNMPITVSGGAIVHPQASDLPALSSYAEGALAFQLQVFTIPVVPAASTNTPPTTSNPILICDVAIPR